MCIFYGRHTNLCYLCNWWYPIDGEKEWNATTVSVSFVGFSLDGKIGMEFYYGVFAFFTRLIRDRLSQFRLADSLLVHITE